MTGVSIHCDEFRDENTYFASRCFQYFSIAAKEFFLSQLPVSAVRVCSLHSRTIEQTFLRDRVASQLSGFVIGVLAINSNAGKRVSTINIG